MGAIKSMTYLIDLSWNLLMSTALLLVRLANVTISVSFVGKKKRGSTVLVWIVQLFTLRVLFLLGKTKPTKYLLNESANVSPTMGFPSKTISSMQHFSLEKRRLIKRFHNFSLCFKSGFKSLRYCNRSL